MSFRDDNRAMQELAKEIAVLRNHNLTFKEGDSQDTYLIIAEGAMVCLALEHFLRCVLEKNKITIPDKATLHPLLTEAVKNNLIVMPFVDQQDGIKKMANVRNTTLHGNYKQAAQESGASDVNDYFKNHFPSEVEKMYRLSNEIISQIDINTGKPNTHKP